MGFWSWVKGESNKKEKEVKTQATEEGEPIIPDVKPLMTSEDYPYVIQLYDIFGSNSKELEPFAAKREIIGGNVYLVNEKVGFKERFPEDTDTYREHKINELDKKIQSTEDKLKELKSNEATPEQLDLKSDLKLFRNWKKSLELQGKGSYVVYTANKAGSKPKFSFDRKGNFKLPIFKDIDHSLLRVPSEAQITTASELLAENEKKNGTPDNTNRLLSFGLVIILCLTVCFMGWVSVKHAQQPTDTALALVNISKSMEKIGVSFENAGISIKESSENINELIDRVEISDKPPSVTPAQNTAR